MKPSVSVCIATYNHEAYIAKTLDSILGQKGDYLLEILIHDDASTDSTPTIIRDYQRRFPQVINPIFQEVNQYQQAIAIDPTFNYPRAKGKYIALCEGDDWWCDVSKLEKQVRCMEGDPKASFLFTNAFISTHGSNDAMRPFFPYRASEADLGLDKPRQFNLGEMCKINFAPTASYFFPTKALALLPTTFTHHYCPHGDLKLRLFLTATSHALYLPSKTCVYRENVPNSAMQRWTVEGATKESARAKSVMLMLDDVNQYSKGKYEKSIAQFYDWFAQVMLVTAPTVDILTDPDAKRIYNKYSPYKRLRFQVKHIVNKFRKQKGVYK